MHLVRSPLIHRAAAIVAVVLLIKVGVHFLGWEVLLMNPLFPGLIAANVFLMGFLISGVLTDYKESERLPGELAVSLEAICDELSIISQGKGKNAAVRCLEQVAGLASDILDWLHKRKRSEALMQKIHTFNESFMVLESVAQPNFIARMKQDQTNVRRLIVRIRTIRDTTFVSSGYVIAEATTLLVTTGLILLEIDPFYESLFFVAVISFLFCFLLLLIRQLDNPFGYYESNPLESVSLRPLEDLARELASHRQTQTAPPSD